MRPVAFAEEADLAVVTSTTKQMMKALDINGDGRVSSQFLVAFLERAGLLRDDIRLKKFFEYLA